jgi:hypothetical protein
VFAMISKYFKEFDKKVIKKKKTAVKGGPKKGKEVQRLSVDISSLESSLVKIIPSHLRVGKVRPIDAAGFSPEGVDLLIYREYCPDIINLLGGYIPHELVYGMVHIIEDLNKASLGDALMKVITAKKLNMYAADQQPDDKPHIPSFIIAASSKYQFNELKNDIINFYLSRNIEYQGELDILMVLNKGIVVKNWREKRSFIALETNDDTFMWFFILMNEYLDINKETTIDFRKYVKKEVIYSEY